MKSRDKFLNETIWCFTVRKDLLCDNYMKIKEFVDELLLFRKLQPFGIYKTPCFKKRPLGGAHKDCTASFMNGFFRS